MRLGAGPRKAQASYAVPFMLLHVPDSDGAACRMTPRVMLSRRIVDDDPKSSASLLYS